MNHWRVTCAAAWVATAAMVVACGNQSSQVPSSVYTPAHATFSAAVRHFFNVHPKATQPIPFPHKTHIEKQAMCTDCHETVERVRGMEQVEAGGSRSIGTSPQELLLHARHRPRRVCARLQQ